MQDPARFYKILARSSTWVVLGIYFVGEKRHPITKRDYKLEDSALSTEGVIQGSPHRSLGETAKQSVTPITPAGNKT